MSTMNTPEVMVTVTSAAAAEVQKFMQAENVSPDVGGLRVSVQPGGCSGFKYSLLIEDKPADDDTVLPQAGFNLFVDPFSMQYLSGVTVDRRPSPMSVDNLRKHEARWLWSRSAAAQNNWKR